MELQILEERKCALEHARKGINRVLAWGVCWGGMLALGGWQNAAAYKLPMLVADYLGLFLFIGAAGLPFLAAFHAAFLTGYLMRVGRALPLIGFFGLMCVMVMLPIATVEMISVHGGSQFFYQCLSALGGVVSALGLSLYGKLPRLRLPWRKTSPQA